MEFLKDFINVLSASSISFLLLSSIFALILYFNLSGGTLRAKGDMAFIAFGVLLVVAGLVVKPLLYLGIAYLLILFGLAQIGGLLWGKKVGARLGIGAGASFALSMLNPNFFLIAAKPDNVPNGAMIFLLG